MAGFNRVILIGNLTRDPEYKQLTSGQAVCRLGLATNRQFKNRQTGAMVQEVCYIDVDVWGAQAESCKQYLQKGRPVLIEGRIKFDTWEDANGQTRSKHSIVADRVVFLGSGGAQESEEVRELDPKEKDVMNQIEQLKAKAQAKPAAAPRGAVKDADAAPKKAKKAEAEPTATGEIAFEDEPPFLDDLPF
ncbi:MAG TPA: single-stranded DNA-binding protein [Candidatus Babeliales bacterium]|nr:single-stranded DNA-binding protein [Candidatus Babeliales bacterium]